MKSNLAPTKLDLLLALLSDGEWHSTEELIEKVGHRFSAVVHVARTGGYKIERRRDNLHNDWKLILNQSKAITNDEAKEAFAAIQERQKGELKAKAKMTYNFKEQLTLSKDHEALLDQYLEDFFLIRTANPSEERQGIDRIIRFKSPFFKVEYKCDSRADSTKNAFIETKSVVQGDRTMALGWAFTTQADLVIYYLTQSKTGYLINPTKLREMLPQWEARYPSRRVSTQSSSSHYQTEGLLVPLSVLTHLFSRIHFPYE